MIARRQAFKLFIFQGTSRVKYCQPWLHNTLHNRTGKGSALFKRTEYIVLFLALSTYQAMCIFK